MRTLNRLFAASNTTFATCVRDQRLRGAMADLEAAPASVSLSAVAAQWGFYDSSHMTQMFQQQLGCTPSQYREAQRIRATDRTLGRS